MRRKNLLESSLKLRRSLRESQKDCEPLPSSSIIGWSPACRLPALRTDRGMERWLATMEPRCCHTEDRRRGIEMTECLLVRSEDVGCKQFKTFCDTFYS